MRSKVYSIRISVPIIIISLVIMNTGLIDKYQFLDPLCMGILTSGLVTMIIHYTEYCVEKRRTHENLWIALNRVVNRFNNLKYLNIEEPINLVTEYYYLNGLNDFCFYIEDEPGNIYPDLEIKLEKNKDELKLFYLQNQYQNNHFVKSMTKDKQMMFLDKEIEVRFHKMSRKLEEIIQQYNKLAELKLDDVFNAYGELYYLTINCKGNKIRIYNDLIQPHINMCDQLLELNLHLNQYIAEESTNTAVILEKIIDFQKSIFNVKHEKNKTIVYNTYYSQSDNNLEKFRAEIYKQEPELKRKRPCLTLYYPDNKLN